MIGAIDVLQKENAHLHAKLNQWRDVLGFTHPIKALIYWRNSDMAVQKDMSKLRRLRVAIAEGTCSMQEVLSTMDAILDNYAEVQ